MGFHSGKSNTLRDCCILWLVLSIAREVQNWTPYDDVHPKYAQRTGFTRIHPDGWIVEPLGFPALPDAIGYTRILSEQIDIVGITGSSPVTRTRNPTPQVLVKQGLAALVFLETLAAICVISCLSQFVSLIVPEAILSKSWQHSFTTLDNYRLPLNHLTGSTAKYAANSW